MLILVGQLDNKGHQVAFGDQKWKVKNGNLVVAKGINTVHYIQRRFMKMKHTLSKKLGHLLYGTKDLGI